MSSTPSIDEAVYLLDQFAPAKLEKLRHDLPELGPYLDVGGQAGPAAPLLVARLKVCRETLSELTPLCNRGIENAQIRLRRQKTLSLIGGITATIASASVIASLSASVPPVAFAGGVVSLVGSLAALLSEHFGKVPRTDLSLFDAYRQLVEARSESMLVLAEIRAFTEVGADEKDENEIVLIIGRSEKVFREVHDLLSALEIAQANKKG